MEESKLIKDPKDSERDGLLPCMVESYQESKRKKKKEGEDEKQDGHEEDQEQDDQAAAEGLTEYFMTQNF